MPPSPPVHSRLGMLDRFQEDCAGGGGRRRCESRPRLMGRSRLSIRRCDVDRRVGAVAGLVAVALLIVGFFIPGTPPKASDSAVKITNYLIDKRGSLLAGQLILGLGLAFLVFWLGALRSHLRGRSDDGGAAVAAVGGGLIGV